MRQKLSLLFVVILLSIAIASVVRAGSMSMSARSTIAIKNWTLPLQNELASHNLELGNPVFFRIIKQPSMTTSTGRLEAFVENTSGEFEFFKAWDICNYSGDLGPKLKQGDRQPPEGFYFVTPAQLNPNSSYHLSFNLGYPNAYDRAHERTGDFLMVHGDCVSVGCYAMTDTGIEEIYTLLQSALAGGQDFVRVHAFPFPMTDENMRAVEGHKNFPFWQNLQEGWNWFETYKRPPNTEVKSKRYVFAADR